MQNAQSEILDMGETENVTYRFNELAEGSTKGFISSDPDGTVAINYLPENSASTVHELKHGYQVLIGELEAIPGSDKFRYLDLNDERASYFRQYFYNPESVKQNVPSDIYVYNYKSITNEWIKTIYMLHKNGFKEHIYQFLPNEDLRRH